MPGLLEAQMLGELKDANPSLEDVEKVNCRLQNEDVAGLDALEQLAAGLCGLSASLFPQLSRVDAQHLAESVGDGLERLQTTDAAPFDFADLRLRAPDAACKLGLSEAGELPVVGDLLSDGHKINPLRIDTGITLRYISNAPKTKRHHEPAY